MNTNTTEFSQIFMSFSEVSTGFSIDELVSTGQSKVYLDLVSNIIGAKLFGEFLSTYHSNGIDHVLASIKLGPIARNIIKLWLTGTWEKFSTEEMHNFDDLSSNETFVVSSRAYAEGLLWPMISAKPPGARAGGFSSWSTPPNFYKQFNKK